MSDESWTDQEMITLRRDSGSSGSLNDANGGIGGTDDIRVCRFCTYADGVYAGEPLTQVCDCTSCVAHASCLTEHLVELRRQNGKEVLSRGCARCHGAWRGESASLRGATWTSWLWTWLWRVVCYGGAGVCGAVGLLLLCAYVFKFFVWTVTKRWGWCLTGTRHCVGLEPGGWDWLVGLIGAFLLIILVYIIRWISACLTGNANNNTSTATAQLYPSVDMAEFRQGGAFAFDSLANIRSSPGNDKFTLDLDGESSSYSGTEAFSFPVGSEIV